MTVRVERQRPVTTVVLARPRAANAVDRATALALTDGFRAFDADDGALAAVLCGDGTSFCAGGNLNAVDAGNPNRVDPEGDAPMDRSRMLLSKPVVAAVGQYARAIGGHAVAGGVELALWCDVRVAGEDAVLGVFCRRSGVPPLIDGGTVRLPRLIGLSRALDLILTGWPGGAAEAVAIGLVNRVVPSGTCRAAAEQLARFPQDCMRYDRLSAYEGLELPFDAAMRHEFEHGPASLGAGAAEGAARFARGEGRHGAF